MCVLTTGAELQCGVDTMKQCSEIRKTAAAPRGTCLLVCLSVCLCVCRSVCDGEIAGASDATIYRPNDISSRYWPYRIVSISSRKISKFRYMVIVSISFQYRRNDVDVVYLFSFCR